MLLCFETSKWFGMFSLHCWVEFNLFELANSFYFCHVNYRCVCRSLLPVPSFAHCQAVRMSCVFEKGNIFRMCIDFYSDRNWIDIATLSLMLLSLSLCRFIILIVISFICIKTMSSSKVQEHLKRSISSICICFRWNSNGRMTNICLYTLEIYPKILEWFETTQYS